MKKYIHYGSKEFDNNRFAPIVNTMMTKPTGGLWASPINCKYGWKEWNKHNELKICDINNSFVFSLRKNAKIIHI